ncbi:MAG: hypothetical protein GYA41_13065 [Bacteroidales bacterium]|nr:hypothetical protein [Bacteroidales bacterium]
MHEKFRYKTSEDLIRKASELGFELPFSDDVTPLLESVKLGETTIPNRLVVQPMEGYDSDSEGAPTELTERRYLRYSAGASGVIWFEAVSVNHEGRSNPRQLWINSKSTDKFAYLTEKIRKYTGIKGGSPFLVIQLTHSGRYSKPDGKPAPRVAALNPLLDKTTPVVLTDDDLKRLQDHYVSAAKLASRAGFDAVDLKACHGYLMIELLAAKSRKDSIFGGEDPEKRFRFLLETYDRIKNEVTGIKVTSRLNISDLYKGGFGVDEKDQPDFTEPLMLVGQLRHRGIELLNISMGSPYFNAHISRPYDTPLPGMKVPDEHPLQGVMRMINGTSIFQKRFPEILIAGSAYSWLRHYAPNVGAAIVKKGGASLIGFGRNSFAYPSMPLDLMNNGKADSSKTCITCSGCTRLIRNFHIGGCVIRDREIYGSELKKLVADGK